MQANPLNKGPHARDEGPNMEPHDTVAQCVRTAHTARDRKRNNGRLQGIRKQCSKWILGNVSAEVGYLVLIKSAYKNSHGFSKTES